MNARLDGHTALITGAGRGQGRAHALRLAAEGASVVVTDLGHDLDEVGYPLATGADLDQTAALVAKAGGRVLAVPADVRSQADLDAAVAAGQAEFGPIDIVCANAGITAYGRAWQLTEPEWLAVVDVNLNGVWRTVKAAVPGMIEAGRGGSIVITSSAGGRRGIPHAAHYVSTKHGLVGLMRTLANELARYQIRVNTVHPTAVDTPMIHNPLTYRLFCPDVDQPTRADAEQRFRPGNPLGVPWIQPEDVSNAVAWLVSDEGKYVTGSEIPVDAGFFNKV
jgi:SDR family mycofactocin-dependent oxidoreductase